MTTNKLQEILGSIQQTMLSKMLQDLKDPQKCTPQLYNAIIKELQRNGIDCLPKAGQGEQNALQRLLDGTRSSMEDSYGESLYGSN